MVLKLKTPLSTTHNAYLRKVKSCSNKQHGHQRLISNFIIDEFDKGYRWNKIELKEYYRQMCTLPESASGLVYVPSEQDDQRDIPIMKLLGQQKEGGGSQIQDNIDYDIPVGESRCPRIHSMIDQVLQTLDDD